MTVRTLGALAQKHDAPLLDYHDLDIEIPVISGLQFQGDVAVIPVHVAGSARGVDVPPSGVPVVRGENGGNTHLLVADGPVLWQSSKVSATRLALGVVTVPAGSVAYLTHPEHGFNAIGPGQYEIRRQREQREEIALIAD